MVEALLHDFWLERRVGTDRYFEIKCSRCGRRYSWATPRSRDWLIGAFVTEHGGDCEPERP